MDYIFGSGLRQGFANTQSLPSYAEFDASVTRNFKASGIGDVDVRFAIVNLHGPGVRDPQWHRCGRRRSPIRAAPQLLRGTDQDVLMCTEGWVAVIRGLPSIPQRVSSDNRRVISGPTWCNSLRWASVSLSRRP